MSHRKIRTDRPPAEPVSVVTGMNFPASPERVWRSLMFFEQIGRRPPLHLRLLLPAPVGAEGGEFAVGDESRCLYAEGHLIKRVTEVVPGRLCRFDVVEQRLAIRGGIRLAGGTYTLQELPGGSTRVELETRFVSRQRPRRFWRPIEAAVCHTFHRHILDAIRRAVDEVGVSPDLLTPASAKSASQD